MRGRTVVLLCGEPERGDDGAPFAAAELLSPRGRTGMEVRLVGQLAPDDLTAVGPRRRCVLVDTVRGIPAGSVIAVPLARVADVAASSATSSHVLQPQDAVALARAVGRLPEGLFVGIGGVEFSLGASLSPEVRQALPALAGRVEEAVAQLAAPEDPVAV